MPVIKPGDFSDDRVKVLLTRHLEGMYASSPPGTSLPRVRQSAQSAADTA
jgi:hypothetical protein